MCSQLNTLTLLQEEKNLKMLYQALRLIRHTIYEVSLQIADGKKKITQI